VGFRQLHRLHRARERIVRERKLKVDSVIIFVLPEKPTRLDLQKHGATLGWVAITAVAFVVSFVLGCALALVQGVR